MIAFYRLNSYHNIKQTDIIMTNDHHPDAPDLSEAAYGVRDGSKQFP